MVELGQARRADREEITALLTASGLPSGDLDPHLTHFTVARVGGRLVGVIGVEVHGEDGLLRSLTVAEDHRGRGIARRLYAAALADALHTKLARLFLLAPAAQAWFRLLGFRAVARDAVPEPVRATEHFRELAARGALVMVRRMPRA